MKLASRMMAVVTILSFVLTAGCIPNPSYDPADATTGATKKVESEERVYEVFGMGCPACHGGLTDLVEEISGVQAATANWEAQRLTVTLEPGAELDDKKIADAVERANFTYSKRIK